MKKESKAKKQNLEENENVTTETVAEQPDGETVAEEQDTKMDIIGVVTNCQRLNVRSAPSSDADIICSIPANTVVTITDDSEEIHPFYKVCTAFGVEGFCIKLYITVQPQGDA
jgi:uncharacterized protein YgiM (DUF1202 family)